MSLALQREVFLLNIQFYTLEPWMDGWDLANI